MQCPYCGTQNPNGVIYCVNCKRVLAQPQSNTLGKFQTGNSQQYAQQPAQSAARPDFSEGEPSVRSSAAPATNGVQQGPRMRIAEGEKLIKTYLCTYYKAGLFGIRSKGNLIVTNKRVIFHAQGKSGTKQSIIQSEIPVENISGIVSYQGSKFNLIILLAILIVSAAVGPLVFAIMSAITLGSSTAGLIIGLVLGIGCVAGSFYFSFKKIGRTILVLLSAIFVGSTAIASKAASTVNYYQSFLGGSQQSGVSDLGIGFMTFLAVCVLIYGIVCAFIFADRPAFSLNIMANSASSPISIGNGMKNITGSPAGKAMNAEPAQDSEKVIAELGALVLDIQKMGDLAIDKWKRS